VADLVLLNDSFAVLPFAVREGQRIVNGMQDILKLYMTRIFYVMLMIVSTGIVSGFPFSPKHSSMVALMAVGLPTLALAAWARPARPPHTSLLRRLLHFVLPATVLQSLFGLGIYLAYLTAAFYALAPGSPMLPALPAYEDALLVGQTALAVFSIFCGLLLVVFVEPPSAWWAGGDACRGDRRPAFLALGLLVGFVVFLFVPGARTFFDFTPMRTYDYLIIGGLAVVWGLLLRRVWRSRLLDRFLEVDLSEGEPEARK
jgi:cation-transporting ATPase E